QTFGKGTVQELIPVTDGQMKITRAKFYRISGESTQRKGVVPDIAFPSLLDTAEDLGESALPHALPWDTIDANYYQPVMDLNAIVPTLASRHQNRIAADPDFSFINAQIDRARENIRKNELTLNEARLIAEREENDRWRLETENSRRIAKGLKPVPDVEALDDETDITDTINENGTELIQDEESTADDMMDPYLAESSEILLDLKEIMAANRVTLVTQ
ncbi:MAG: carboxy terminal-processing peptidase, partial [Pseudohongiellaceae bacterium]